MAIGGGHPGAPGGDAGERGPGATGGSSRGGDTGGGNFGGVGSVGGFSGAESLGAPEDDGGIGGFGGAASLSDIGSRRGDGGENIRGAQQARDNFSFNATSRAPSMSTFGSRSTRMQAPTASVNDRRGVASRRSRVASTNPVIDTAETRSRPGRPSVTSIADDQSVADIQQGYSDILSEELEEAQNDGFVRDFGPTMLSPMLGPLPGILEMAIGDTADNKKAAQNTYDRTQALASEYGMTLEETPLNSDISSIREGIRTAQVPFTNDEQVVSQTVAGTLPSYDPVEREGGGDELPVPITPPDVQSIQTPSPSRLGDIRNYSSYARSVFSTI